MPYINKNFEIIIKDKNTYKIHADNRQFILLKKKGSRFQVIGYFHNDRSLLRELFRNVTLSANIKILEDLYKTSLLFYQTAEEIKLQLPTIG